MAGPVEERGCFITDITVSPDNDIVIAIESEEGTVVMDDCVAVNDAFLAAFDQDKEDYSLTVTSAGLDQPFKIVRQYVKAVGTKVVVKTRDGRKITGKMESADENGFTVSQGEESANLPWDQIYKMVATKSNVLVYSTRINAYIIPREQLGEQYKELAKIANEKLPKHRVKMQ